MAELVPLKAVYDGSSICGLSELRDGDVVGVEHGGLGVCTIPSNTLLIGNGQGAISTTSALTTNGQIIIGGTGGPQIANLTGTSNEVEITDGNGAITIGLPATVQISTNLKTPAFSITNEYCLPTADGSAGQIMCTDGSGALSFIDFDGSGHCIAFSGTTVADRTCLNFLGGGVTVSDNSGTNATDITIPVTTPELKVRNTAGCELSIELENTAIGGELVCDTTPQLGGTLDVNGYGITSVSNGNISITPNGSGSVVLDGLSWPQADGTAGYILCTDGSGSLSWATDASGQSVAGSNTQVQFNNSGNFGASSNLTFDGTTLAATAFTATGNVSLDGGTFVFNESGADKDFRVEGDSEANLLMIDASTDRIGIGTATPSHLVDIEGVGHAATCFVSADLCATTKVVAPALCIGSEYVLPTADGSAGQIMCTNGSGALAFATASAGVTLAGSTNNTIATVTGSDALAGEANLTFDGTDLAIGNTAPSSYMDSVHGLIIGDTSDATSEIVIASSGVGELNFTDTADTTNQASIFYTHSNANFDFKTTQSGGAFKFSPDTGGSVLLQVGDAWSNARVGIGTTAPDGVLHVATADLSMTPAAHADDSVLELGAQGGFSLLTPDANGAYYNFGSPSNNAYASIYGFYNSGSPLMQLNAANHISVVTNSVERMKIDSTGNTIIKSSSTAAFDSDSTLGNLQIINTAADTDNQFAGIAFSVGNGASDGQARIDAIHNGTGAEADLAFSTRQSSGNVYERMRISSIGQVTMAQFGRFQYLGQMTATTTWTNIGFSGQTSNISQLQVRGVAGLIFYLSYENNNGDLSGMSFGYIWYSGNNGWGSAWRGTVASQASNTSGHWGYANLSFRINGNSPPLLQVQRSANTVNGWVQFYHMSVAGGSQSLS